jgi:Transposase
MSGLNSGIAAIGIDIGKNSFHVVGQDERGALVLRQKWSRGQVEARLANLPACLIGMEACVGAHHLSRKLQALGHDARLMPAKYVRPYSKGQKNDFRDAEAIAEAVQRPTMKFVATKTAEQLDLQALHRVRERQVGQRTGIINQIRAFLLERGIAVRQGLRFLRAELPTILATRSDVLSARMLRLIEDLAGDWRRLDERIEAISGEIEALARQDQACERLGRSGSAMASARGSRQPRSDCITTCWPSRSPTSSPASRGRSSTGGAPSSASRRMRWRPGQRDPRAVLGPVKAWPGDASAQGKASATANLDSPCARRARTRRPGRRNGRKARTKEQLKIRSSPMT